MSTDNLPPAQYLILEVLAARYRCGEHLWTFPSNLSRHLKALEAAGLIHVMHGDTAGTRRARLTDKGLAESLSTGYNVPTPTLAQALDTLPASNDDYLAWMRAHGLGHGAGVATVISAVRDDLRKLAEGER